MSIAAFYRTYIPFIEIHSFYSGGKAQFWLSPPTWVKGNLQPFKQGLMMNMADVGAIYTDWKTLYVRKTPEFDLTGRPEQAEYLRAVVYINGRWFDVTATQDWTTAGRAPKHYKYIAVATTVPDGEVWPEPVPLASLVARFESAVRELQQTTVIVNELI